MSPFLLDTDTIVIGTLTTLRPDRARPVWDLLEPHDFPRRHAARAFDVCLASLDAPMQMCLRARTKRWHGPHVAVFASGTDSVVAVARDKTTRRSRPAPGAA